MKQNKQKLYDAPRYRDLKEMIEDCVRKYKDKTAFIIKHKHDKKVEYKYITYQKMKDDIDALGTALIQLGLKDKRIAIIAKNRYEWCISYLATMNGVGIVVPLDKSLPDNEIGDSLRRSRADAVIFESKYLKVMENIKEKHNNDVKQYICMDKVSKQDMEDMEDVLEIGRKALKEGERNFLDATINAEEMRVILFTSGTTSLSKAVMLSHKNIVENIYALTCIVKVYDTDVSLAFLPLHHTFGATGFLFFLSNGAAAAFCDGIKYIQSNLKEYKISIFVCVPLLLEMMYKKINKEVERQGKTKILKLGRKISNFLLHLGIDIRRKLFKEVLDQLGGNLRLAVSGAAAIDKEVAKGFNEMGIEAIQGYGLTETAPVLTAENDEHIRFGSVGFPLLNVEVAIDNPNEKGIGEVKAKGPNVMLGYYEMPKETKEVLKDGWFYTGDLGYIDKDGYLFITGRKKNVIVLKNGKNIYPEELEVLINNLPYVVESMAFGYPKDDDLLLSAKIVYNEEYLKEILPEANEEEIKEYVWKDIKEKINKGMPNYKHIKKIIVTTEPMIKTTTQKVKRFEEIKKIVEK